MKRLYTAVAAILLASILASCAGEGKTGTAAASSSSETSATTAEDVTNTGLARRKYDDYDYGGYIARFLTRGTDENSFWNELYFDEQKGEVLSDAIYSRNMRAEELLNVKIDVTWTDDGFEGALTRAQNAILAGEDSYDFILTSMQFVVTPLARQGMLLNLRDVSSIELSDSWWDANIVENFTLFNDTLYQISGDFNFFDDYAASGALMNKKLCGSVDFELPYQSVRDGSWTIDKLAEIGKAYARDLNGNGKMDLEDDVGYIDNSAIMIHNYYSAGYGLTRLDGDGNLYYDVEDQRCVDTIDRIKAVFGDGMWTISSDSYADIRQKFIDGGAMFYATGIGGLLQVRDMVDDFAVLPNPKITEEQSGYGAFVSNGWLSAAAIPITAADPERNGAILDCIAMLSTDTVKTAVYDMMLSTKLVRDDESVEMINDYILPYRVYDYVSDVPGGDGMSSMCMTPYNNVCCTHSDSSTSAVRTGAARHGLVQFLHGNFVLDVFFYGFSRFIVSHHIVSRAI